MHLPLNVGAFNTITSRAVGGHITTYMRRMESQEFARVLRIQGRLIMTEGEPIAQHLHHKWVYMLDKICGTNIDVDTMRGMHEDDEYCMAHSEIFALWKEAGFVHIVREKFQWGLNNIFVAEKTGK